MRDLSDTRQAVAAVIANGQGRMPAFRRVLSPAEIRRLALFVRRFK